MDEKSTIKRKKYSDWAEEYPNHLVLTHAGYFYMSWGRAAEVLNEILDYTLAYSKKGNVPYTGGTSLDIILEALQSNCINYIVVDKGQIIEQCEYETCDEVFYRKEDFPVSTRANKYSDISDEEKLQVIDALLRGIDPSTGEVLDADSFVNEDAFKAVLVTALHAIERKQMREKYKKPSSGARWTEDEEARLVEEYNNNLSISEIAEMHGRSTSSIQNRLIKLAQISIE